MYETLFEVNRAIACLTFLRLPGIQCLSSQVVSLASRWRPAMQIVKTVTRPTFFALFCGGEELRELGDCLRRLEFQNVVGIVDYAAEAPLVSAAGSGPTIDYESSAARTRDLIRYLGNHFRQPQVAIKLTGFMPHTDLCRTSELIRLAQWAFFLASDGQKEKQPIFGEPLDILGLMGKPLSLDLIRNRLGVPMSEQTLRDLLAYGVTLVPGASAGSSIDAGVLPFHVFETLLTDYIICAAKPPDGPFAHSFKGGPKAHPLHPLLHGLVEFAKPKMQGRSEYLDYLSEVQDCKMENGLIKIPPSIGVGHSLMGGVLEELKDVAMTRRNASKESCEPAIEPFALMDAEGSEIQSAIHLLTTRYAMNVNHDMKSVLLGNTYQHYLKETSSRLILDRAVFDGYAIPFGAKMVRGAYMASEARRAVEMGRENPVHDTIEATHHSYNRCIRQAVEDASDETMRIVFGTHNRESVDMIKLSAAQLREEGRILPDGSITVAQLMGMSDQLTSDIQATQRLGIHAGKYVPYGPLDLVVPYLLRRVEENVSALDRITEDISYLKSLRKKIIKDKYGLTAVSSSSTSSDQSHSPTD